MGFGGIGPGSLLIILVIVVLLFGTKKFRNIGSDLGSALRNFKKAVKDDDKIEHKDAGDEAGLQSGKIIEGESSKVEEKEKQD